LQLLGESNKTQQNSGSLKIHPFLKDVNEMKRKQGGERTQKRRRGREGPKEITAFGLQDLVFEVGRQAKRRGGSPHRGENARKRTKCNLFA